MPSGDTSLRNSLQLSKTAGGILKCTEPSEKEITIVPLLFTPPV